jgi:AmmeMemoRadiSam system protein B
MQIRRPVVAGQFYPGTAAECKMELKEYLAEGALPAELPEEIIAGIVPHAGWTFSGQLAALVFAAIKKQNTNVDTFCIFGAAHSYFGPQPAVCDSGAWQTPLGNIAIDEDLAQVVSKTGSAVADPNVHRGEHSIEVQVPFIQHLFPDAKILPIITPPDEAVIELGTAVGQILSETKDKKIVCIGSTDLTHYGPHYGFEPAGQGRDAFKWASEVNDKQFIDLALKLEPQKMLDTAARNYNACGAGAAAAAVAVAKKLGKTKGLLLAHTHSSVIMAEKYNSPSTDSVGYAAIVF